MYRYKGKILTEEEVAYQKQIAKDFMERRDYLNDPTCKMARDMVNQGTTEIPELEFVQENTLPNENDMQRDGGTQR